jgi:hypothetical protein
LEHDGDHHVISDDKPEIHQEDVGDEEVEFVTTEENLLIAIIRIPN